MPIVVTERAESRSGVKGRSERREFAITGTADGDAAAAALEASPDAPPTIPPLVRRPVEVRPVYVDVDEPDQCVWQGIAAYELGGSAVPKEKLPDQTPLEADDVCVRATTLGGSQRVTWSKERLGAWCPPGGTIVKAHGIGDNGRGDVEGVEIHAPAEALEVTKAFVTAQAPDHDTLFARACHTNDASWSVTDTKTGRTYSYAKGEVLFLGHSEARARLDGVLEITYHFLASRNLTPIVMEGIGTIQATKPGWAYFWLRFEQAEDAAGKRLYAEAVTAYLERLYDEAAFVGLGLAPPPPPP